MIMKKLLSNWNKWSLFLFLLIPFNVFAAGPPKPSDMSNPFAQVLLVVIIVLAVCIAILANVLLGAAQIKMKKEKAAKLLSVIVLLALGNTSFAQDATTATKSDLISGISSNGFYGLLSVVFLELIILLALIYNLKFMLRKEKVAILETEGETEMVQKEATSFSKWWDNFNQFKPVQEEAAIDLGHDYDGIRELDNRLPPWWLYGFYLCVIFAGIYLWRYHVAHSAPLSKEELAIEIQKGEEDKAAYLKNAANNVDETTVKYLTAEADLAAGKKIFSTVCAACHLADGGGSVGPNLTDEYWIHGGSIQDIFKTLKYGWVEKGMKSWKDDYTPMQIAQISSFVKSLQGTKPAKAKEPQGTIYTDTGSGSSDSTKAKVDSAITKAK